MKQLGLGTKTAFGVGQVAEGAKNSAFNIFLLFYFTAVLGLPGSLVGAALLIATTFDAVTDPLAGAISDRMQHRWGRRHPFLYASALPLGITFALLFRPPSGLGEMGLFAWLTTFALLVRASMTLYHVPHLALGAELSRDYAERTSIVAFRTFFGLVGIALVVTLGWGVFFRPSPAFANGQLDPSGYPSFGLAIACVITISVLVSALGTHSRIPYLPTAPDAPPPLSLRHLLGSYRDVLANDSFRGLFIGVVFFFVMRGVQEVLQVHMATYFWRLDPREILAVQLATVPGLLIGVPLWTYVARRTDKRPTFLVGVSLFSVFVLLPPIAKIAGAFPVRESAVYLPLLALASALAAMCAVAGIVMAGSMMADIADEHELAVGRRQEGIFFGALAFSAKAAIGMGAAIGGFALSAIRFPVQVAPETVAPGTVLQLGIIAGPGIAVLMGIGILVMSRYNLTRERVLDVQFALAERSRSNAPAEPPAAGEAASAVAPVAGVGS